MTSAHALIAEDEPLLAAALRTELAELWPALEIVAVSPNGSDALEQLWKHRPEIAFLDVRMPGMSGVEVARAVVEDWPSDQRAPLLVFVTAYDQFAVDAFTHAAVDYVLKPVQRDRLRLTCARLQQRLAQRGPEMSVDALAERLRALLTTPGSAPLPAFAADRPGMPLRYLRASHGESVRLIPVDAVLYLQADDKYVTIVTDTGEALIREPLKDLLPRLDPRRFVQIHRSTIVNLDRVDAAVRDDSGKLRLRMRGIDRALPVSRLYAPLFKPM